jgi:hypothetical protein
MRVDAVGLVAYVFRIVKIASGLLQEHYRACTFNVLTEEPDASSDKVGSYSASFMSCNTIQCR